MVYITYKPIYVDGVECGRMTVQRRGLYTCFDGEMQGLSKLVRLYAQGNDGSAYLGIVENHGKMSVIHRKFSDEDMKKFPREIMFYTDNPDILPHHLSAQTETAWVKHPDGTMTTVKNGKMFVALPAKLRKHRKCFPTVHIDGGEYIVFPR